ncbi:MAG: HAD family hydrolase [Clostridia bacterium]|nr:HAD family hydrolase [Clostridia bacterium]
MKKLIIFDLDGTLLYTLDDIKETLNVVLQNNGYPTLSSEQVLKNVGYGAKELVRRSLGNPTEEVLQKVFDEYVPLQEKSQNEYTKLYDGLDSVLVTLKEKGYKLAIVSNKPDSVTQIVYDQLLKQYNFDFVTGNRPGVFNPKPDKTCVEYCLNILKMNSEDAIYVGDSEVDVKTFVNSNVDGIGVTWGYRPKQLLVDAGCVHFASNPNELLEKIINFN